MLMAAFIVGFFVYFLTPMDITLYHTSFICPNSSASTKDDNRSETIHLKDLSQQYDNWKSSFQTPSNCVNYKNVTVVL